MNINPKLFLQLLLIVSLQQLFAQPLNSAADNDRAHRRYWYYRTRFINDFTNIGGNQGDCICFPERNQGTTDNTAKVGPDQIDIMNQYLAALALEYKMLSRFNQSTTETLKEIFYILDTYNRLDSEADLFWNDPAWSGTSLSTDHIPYQGNNNLNGFMLREDMPGDYFNSTSNSQNYKHFNYALNEYNNPSGNNNLGFTGIYKLDNLDDDNPFSNYIPFNNSIGATYPKGKLPLVQEKYHSMLVAFMMLVKYIPDYTGYSENGSIKTFQDGETDIKAEVRKITNRIHPYIRGNTSGAPASDWTLEYPNGVNLSFGAFAQPWSYTNAKMICYINGGYPWSWPCDGYEDAISLSAGLASYGTLSYITGITNDNSVMLGYAHAGSNALVPLAVWPYLPVIPAATAMDLNASTHSIEWMELLRKTLHQSGVLMKQLSVFANPINEAPCTGPHNFGNGNYSSWEWSAQDRNEHPDSRGNLSPFAGNYPGADYMLLHNLFYEHLYQLKDAHNLPGNYTNAGNIPTYNLMDNYDETTLPFVTNTNIGLGGGLHFVYGVDVPSPFVTIGNTIETPGNTKVFQTLSSRAQINPFAPAPYNTLSSKVEYRAGKEITLLPEGNGKPGFEVKYGSDFHAFVQRYICSNGDFGNGMKQDPNQNGSMANNDYESDEMNTMIPLHYIEYPKSNSDLYPQSTDEDPTGSYALIEEQQTQLQQLLIENQQVEQGIYNANKSVSQRFVILPNPNNGVFKIFANKIAATEEFTIVIYDMKGLEVARYDNLKDNVSLDVDFTQLSRGIYMVNISSNLGYKNSKKVSIN